MFGKIKAFLKKHWEIIIYLTFGCVTTFVNFVVYWPLFYWLQWPATASNLIAWIVSVLAAYLTNKPFVFKSTDWSLKIVLPEFIKFVGCRVASGIFETLFLALTVDILHWHGFIMKLIASVVVVILNYIGSKLLVFRKR